MSATPVSNTVAGSAGDKLRLAVNLFYCMASLRRPRLLGEAFRTVRDGYHWYRVRRMVCTLGCGCNAPLLGAIVLETVSALCVRPVVF